MKTWILKAIVQKTISFLPYKHRINYFFQRYVTKGVLLNDTYFTDRLTHAQQHLHFWTQYGNKTLPDSTLELGTGWYPIVPLVFYLHGIEGLHTIDISPLLTHQSLLTTLQKIADYHRSQRLLGYIGNYLPHKIAHIEQLLQQPPATLSELLHELHLTYLVADARHLPLPTNSIDLITSNNTFEHIYPDVLQPILLEFKRVSHTRGGIQSHFVDMTDHFAHFDHSITVYNYLQFSDAQWAVIDNSIQPQNRLRLPHYTQLYQRIGLPITHIERRTDAAADLQKVRIHPQFAHIPTADLAVSHCYIVSQSAPA